MPERCLLKAFLVLGGLHLRSHVQSHLLLIWTPNAIFATWYFEFPMFCVATLFNLTMVFSLVDRGSSARDNTFKTAIYYSN